ncbi:hypothetical protein ALC56_00198 [Trachymyrmex septentrionalis]|uniref:Uncharacterized protein n=1 Tax=Trachymyrmex septentrionalis TaxID=34720 RepID=A0A195FYH1_9HYME|nr:hypothetical protein ALC56_00198 [Trachymyrmex septentrionalis]
MSCVSMSAFFPPSIARVLTILFNHLLISLYQFFTKELGATIIAFSISVLPCFNNVHNRVMHCSVLPSPISSAMMQPYAFSILYHALIILVVNKQLMHWVRRDHVMAYVVLVDVIQELVQIIGNQVLVFEKTRQRRQHIHGWIDLPIVQLTIDVDLALSDISGKIGNWVSDIIVRHSKNWDLRDGAIASLHTAGTLVDRGEIGVHIARETTSTWYLFTSG